MTRRRIVLIAASAVVVVMALSALWVVLNRSRQGRQTTRELQADLTTLKTERDRLRAEVIGAVSLDPRLVGMPDRPFRIGMPTTLAHGLVTTFVADAADQVTLQLGNIRVRKQGAVRRVIHLGDYTLVVRVTQVTARLAAGAPDLRFGGDQVRLAMPVRVSSGSGSAEVDFRWTARKIGGAVCGDMQVLEVVTGTVIPATYRLSGTLRLSTTDEAILVTPRLPALRVKVRVEPSKESWDLLQRTLDAKSGLCGFVLDRVNIRGALEGLLAKGFDVRVPTEKVRPVELPVGIARTLMVRGTPVDLDVKAGGLTITKDMIWLAADVNVSGQWMATRSPGVR